MRSWQGGEKPWVDGEVREIEGEPILCKRGYHASTFIDDALTYSPGGPQVLCRVELSGTINEDSDKMVATRRRLLWHLGPKTTDAVIDAMRDWEADRTLLPSWLRIQRKFHELAMAAHREQSK
jgi:hypothetical protein